MPSFHDVRLPDDISYGATGGPKFNTVVVGSEAGYEQRIGRWLSARLSWDIKLDIWDRARLEALLSFFRARMGKLYGFRFKDWSDYTVGMDYVNGTGWVHGTPQQFGTGTGVQTAFQLTKRYTSGGVNIDRKITRPVTGSVKIFKAGVEQTSGVTVDYATGIVTFSVAPANGNVIAWSGQFDVPVRFDNDDLPVVMEAVASGSMAVKVVELRE